MTKYDNWEKCPKGEVDKKRLEAFCALYSKKLPQDFLDWLHIVNGGEPSYKKNHIRLNHEYRVTRICNIYGLNQDEEYGQLDEVNATLEGNLNKGLIAFTEDPCGNQFAVSLRWWSYGKIIFWDHETADELIVAKNIIEFDSLLIDQFEDVDQTKNIDAILRNDDAISLNALIEQGHSIEELNEYNRILIERAAIQNSVKCIELLHSKGSQLKKALEIAENNFTYFPEHEASVKLLKKLYNK